MVFVVRLRRGCCVFLYMYTVLLSYYFLFLFAVLVPVLVYFDCWIIQSFIIPIDDLLRLISFVVASCFLLSRCRSSHVLKNHMSFQSHVNEFMCSVARHSVSRLRASYPHIKMPEATRKIL